jgi:hypothetical protein
MSKLIEIPSHPKTLEDWFDKVFVQKTVSKSIIHAIGDSGIGKKTKIKELSKEYNVNVIDINCLHEKNHFDLKKKNFILELKSIITHKSIDFFLSGRQSIVVIHNLHIFRDKKFLEQLFELNTITNIVSPVICIFNKLLISERLISHICKKCYAIYVLPKTNWELKEILIDYHKKNNFTEGLVTEIILNETVIASNGNIHKLMILWKHYILRVGVCTNYETITNYKSDDFFETSDIIDIKTGEINYKEESTKTLICNCFETLCDKNVEYYKKIDTIKVYGSLLKLLMSTHICNGLNMTDMSYLDRLDTSIQLMKYLSIGDSVKGVFNVNYSQILQCIIPTYVVDLTTIKSLILPSFPSTSNNQVMRFHPHPPDQCLYISLFMIKYFSYIYENSTSKKNKNNEAHLVLKSMKDWETLIYSLNKEYVYDISLKYFKLFPEYGISKKKINKFFKIYENK